MTTYRGADMRRESGATWQDTAEGELRRVVHAQREEIVKLQRENNELRDEVERLERWAALRRYA